MANEFKIKKGLIVTGASGGTVVDIQGSQGQLFSVTDDLSGSIFAVSDISGVPILDINSSGTVNVDGTLNVNNKVVIQTGATYAQSTDYLYIGGNDLASEDAAIYLGNRGDGTGYGWRFYYAGIGSGNNNNLVIRSENLGSPVDAVTFNQDGFATFANKVRAVSWFQGASATNTLYSAGSTGLLLQTAGSTEDDNDSKIFFRNSGTTVKHTFDTNNGDATFVGQGFSAATSSGDASSTLTTKGYVDGLITGATIYRGAWDPSGGGYGSPDLSGVTQTSGYYYICSAAGTAEPNGTGTEPDTWAVGDWVIYNDVSGTGQWQKIDNSSVLSGVGTGQTVALWEGAGSVTDSETLGNAPITVSGNDTTFAGTGNFGGSVNIASGGDLILTASSGSTDTGDIVFYHTAAEAHRLWSGTNTLNYRTDGGTTYYMLHSGNYTDYNTYTTLTATTQSAGDDTTNVATTEFVTDAVATGVGNYLPLSAGASYPLTDTLYVQENGNKNNGTISMGFGGSGTSKWSFLTGTHYNQATGSGNGTGSAGMAIIGSLATETYNKVYIGGGPYEINAATQIDFWTHSGTLSTQGGTRRGYVDNGGNWFLGDTLWVDAADDYVGIGTTTPGAKLDVQPTASDRKVTRIANDVMSTYFYNTQADAILAWTCGSYYQAEVVITASQTNGGGYNNIYIRGIWSNNYTSHHWDELERVGFLTGSTFTMSVGQNGTTTNSGRLELDFNYVSASFSQLNVRVTDFYGTHSYTIT